MSNLNKNQITDMLKKGAKKEEVNNLINSLSYEDAKKLNQMLNDKEATKQ